MASCKMRLALIPPGFDVHDVRGDGNCFYYSVLSSISRFQNRGSAADAKELKQILAAFLSTSRTRDFLKAVPSELQGLKHRLRTDFAWAEEPEIRLTAELLDVCIFVFKPVLDRRTGEQKWILSSYLPVDVAKICRFHGKALSAQDVLETYFCQDPGLCGHKAIYLLNADENHFVPLERRRRSERRVAPRSSCTLHHSPRSCDRDARCLWSPSHVVNFASRVRHSGVCTDLRMYR